MRLLALMIPLMLLGHPNPPRSGEELVRQMHARYAGKWYRNLTFIQTTSYPDRPVETWYEAGTVPGKLRIDIAPLDSMNAFMYVGDSAIVFKGGKRVSARMSSGPEPTRHTNFVPPASMAPKSGGLVIAHPTQMPAPTSWRARPWRIRRRSTRCDRGEMSGRRDR